VSGVVPLETMEALRTYRWPGNIRELRNWVEATVAMGEAPDLFGREPGAPASESPMLGLPYKAARNVVLERFEAEYLARLLADTNGNVSLAARRAQMDRSYLIKLLQRHRLKASKESE
jgi:DNA-binding NtrC family response regulator